MTKKTTVILRDSRDKLGTRYLAASISPEGTLTIAGQDLGDGVEQIFGPGNREYEWAWTIQAPDVGRLASALDAGDDLLAGLARQFTGDAAAGLKSFLDEKGIPYESWSRIGD